MTTMKQYLTDAAVNNQNPAVGQLVGASECVIHPNWCITFGFYPSAVAPVGGSGRVM